jgi:hypothetical protein
VSHQWPSAAAGLCVFPGPDSDGIEIILVSINPLKRWHADGSDTIHLAIAQSYMAFNAQYGEQWANLLIVLATVPEVFGTMNIYAITLAVDITQVAYGSLSSA